MVRLFFSRKKFSVGLAVIILSWILFSSNTVFSQTAVMPPGEGTQVSPYLIFELGHLVWISNTVANSSNKYYIMTTNINASATATWNDVGTDTNVLEGFKPIGTYTDPDTTSFRGNFDGAGHTITGLTINRRAMNYVGLFGYVGSDGKVQNLGLVGGAITGNCYAGGMIGWNRGIVSNTSTTGVVTGNNWAGGLIGSNYQGWVSDAYATGKVTGVGGVGGLVASNYYGTVSNVYATGDVTGTLISIGGLIGENFHGIVSNAYSKGDVIGHNDVGGLVGRNCAGTVSNVYATGAVTGTGTDVICVGGLMGENSGTIENAYATGKVTGYAYVGGLVGWNRDSCIVSNSYWDIQTSGCSVSASGTGKTTAEMKQQATFIDWDFTNVWTIDENMTYPRLQSFILAPSITLFSNVTCINTTTPERNSAEVILTVTQTIGDAPDTVTLDFGDGTNINLPLSLPQTINHDYSLAIGENSRTFTVSASALNIGGAGNVSTNITILRQPKIALSVNGVSVEDSSTIKVNIFENPILNLSLVNSMGFIENARFQIPSKGLDISGTNLIYFGTLFSNPSDIGKVFSLVSTISNTGTGMNSNTLIVNIRIVADHGDANLDRQVNVGDLGILAANYGGSNKTWAQGDFNGDGKVDVGDLGILAAHYGQGVVNSSLDFHTDYAKVFGTAAEEDDSTDLVSETDRSVCSSLGLPFIVGLAMMGLVLVKLEE